MFSVAWIWMYVGAAFILLEIFLPGFIVFFFGVSAVTVGLLRFILKDALTLSWQLAAFSAFSVLYIVFLRRYFRLGSTSLSKINFENENEGRTAEVVCEIKPPLSGRILLGDSEWNAVCETPVSVGAHVRVVRQENLTMVVEPVS